MERGIPNRVLGSVIGLMSKEYKYFHLPPPNRQTALRTRKVAELAYRRGELKKFIEEADGPLTAPELAVKFFVNVSTIRRDLKDLGIKLKKA